MVVPSSDEARPAKNTRIWTGSQNAYKKCLTTEPDKHELKRKTYPQEMERLFLCLGRQNELALLRHAIFTLLLIIIHYGLLTVS